MNCEGSAMLSYLQANQLACHSVMDAGRRHKTPKPKTKDFIAHSTRSSMNISIFALFLFAHKSHGGDVDGCR